MSKLTLTTAEAEVEAASKGLIVCYPAPNEIQIDVDCEEIPEALEDKLAEMRSHDLIEKVVRSRSQSGKHWHIRVFVTWELSDEERVMWQSTLGSDPTREWLNALRIALGVESSVLFFEKPDWEKSAQ